jgi:hypothetical protein
MLAKGKVYVSREKLTDLLSLPEGVEVLAIKAKEMEDGFEFLIASAEETVATRKGVPIGQLRRTSVDTLEKFRYGNKANSGIVGTGSFQIADAKEMVLTQKDMDRISEIIRSVNLKVQPDLNVPFTTDAITINVTKRDEDKSVKELFNDITERAKDEQRRKRNPFA